VLSATPRFDKTIRAAIAERRLLSFDLDGLPRVGEPHDYGVSNGAHQLLFYQVGGESSSAARAVPSSRHKKWDRLIASVFT